jgi:cell division protein YceG involved in septum cleavage
MKKYLILFCFILSFTMLYSNSFYIAAKSGLLLRKSPNLNSEKVTIIPFMEEVKVLEKKENVEIIDDVKAKWFKVKYRKSEAWLFSGYLSNNRNFEKNKNYYSI